MRVAVIAPQPIAPVFGGAQRVWRGLVDWVNSQTSHDADLVEVPSPERDLETLLDTYEQCSTLDLGAYDLVISSKYPGWMIEHDRHVVYMLHTLRGLYETYPAAVLRVAVSSDDPAVVSLVRMLDLPPHRAAIAELFARTKDLMEARGPEDELFAFPGPLARRLIHYLDSVGLDPSAVSSYFALSRTVADRPGYFPASVQPRVVFPPSDLAGLRSGRDDYLLAPSRLDAPKRHILLVQAMRLVNHDVSLKITGTGPELDGLVASAESDDRIEFLGHRSDPEMAALYADALAVPFVPIAEDFGLVALEAMTASKPVITCYDSGGPTEMVHGGVNGLVVAPDAAEIAKAMNTLIEDRALARVMGAHGRRSARRVSWDRLGNALLDATPRARPVARHRSRPRIVVLSTFPIHPPVGGGQLRCHHLYGSFTPDFDVEFVSMGPAGDGSRRSVLGEGLTETVVFKSPAHEEAEAAIRSTVGIPITDVVASHLLHLTPAYLDVLRGSAVGADAVLLAHPFLHDAARAVATSIPLIYDAHNAETALKEAVLPPTPTGRELLELVRRAEGGAVRDASLVTACSDADIDTLHASFGDFPAELVPNGVDTLGTQFVPPGRRTRAGDAWHRIFRELRDDESLARPTVLFVGSWHPPNVEAARAIFDLAHQLPRVTFIIGGSICSGFSSSDAPSNVVMLRALSDATKRRLLGMADVAVNPMISGSGTNLKMLEYMAAGIPTVSTPVGVRGIEAADGEHLLVRDLVAFPSAIERLLTDRTIVAPMVRQARRLVTERYDWQILGRQMADSIRSQVLLAT